MRGEKFAVFKGGAMKSDAVVFLSGKRTPFGAFGGSLRSLTATELGTFAAQAALEQSGLSASEIGHVIFGNVVQSDANSIYSPRHIGLNVGIPVEVPALGVNRLCGSGFQSLADAAALIQRGEAKFVLAGGIESMSQVPYVAREARWGKRLGNMLLADYLMEALMDQYCGCPMAETAENLAKKYGISRQDSDEYALLSQKRTREASQAGRFQDELISIEVKSHKKSVVLENDEHPRPETTIETLSALKPAFKKDGMITPGNASGMVDGGAAMVLGLESEAKTKGLKPLGRLLSWGISGVEPSLMGIGPAPAVRQALQRAGLKLEQMNLIEVNEAFAPQTLAVQKELGLNPEITNVNGGAIAIGHPLGASGTRITMTALYELKRRKQEYAVVSACIGGGQGIALVIQNIE